MSRIENEIRESYIDYKGIKPYEISRESVIELIKNNLSRIKENKTNSNNISNEERITGASFDK